MECFLDDLIELEGNGSEELIKRVILKNINTHVTSEQIISFSRKSGREIKEKLKGAININGAGGTGFIKPNLSSLVALYIGLSIDRIIVKTGSGFSTGIWGSSNFFNKLGLMDCRKREYIYQKYGFAYYDYLEVSPWKRYKDLLRNNKYLNKLFRKIIFFDYRPSYYFLGVNSPLCYEGLKKLRLENMPSNKLITFYSVVNSMIVDELMSGQVYVDNKLVLNEDSEGIIWNRSDIKKLQKVNMELLVGTSDDYWKKCLKLSYSIIVMNLCLASEMYEACEMFDKVYKDKKVMKMLKEINVL